MSKSLIIVLKSNHKIFVYSYHLWHKRRWVYRSIKKSP